MATLRSTLLGLGAGAAAMYFYDPIRGNYRRSVCRDKLQHYAREMSEAMDVLNRDLSNRMTGMASSITGPEEVNVSDDKLVARVRSYLGRVSSHPKAIEVTARNGRVTLSGPILADEVQQVVRTIKNVPGVQSVDNRLEVHQEAGNIPALQGGGRAPGIQPDILQQSWSPTTQALVAAGGSALLGSLVLGRGMPLLLAAGGLALAASTAQGRSMGQFLEGSMGSSGLGRLTGSGQNDQALSSPVREIMTPDPACCTPDTSLQEVARMMRECDCGAIPVVENNESRRAIGIVTDRDITVRVLAEGRNPMEMRARDCMTRPVASVRADSTLGQLLTLMEDAQIRRVLVVDEGERLVGIVAQADVALAAPRRQAGEVVREVSEPSATHTASAL